jgi:hypothetical protein
MLRIGGAYYTRTPVGLGFLAGVWVAILVPDLGARRVYRNVVQAVKGPAGERLIGTLIGTQT